MRSRRHFLTTLSAAGALRALGARTSLADEAPPETTVIRLSRDANICLAPGYIAEDLLRAEGFTDIRYLADTPGDAVARGEVDFEFYSAAQVVSHLDPGWPIIPLAGIHSGCYELFAHPPIQTVSDLKDRRISIRRLTSGRTPAPRSHGGARRARPP
jgi:NitT/TauT family transport system substrate-binding protein